MTRSTMKGGLARLRSWGFEPVAGRYLWRRSGDLAGPDALRAADLRWALSDPTIDAVWSARGGWGTARLLPGLERIVRRRRPRWVIGFSDLTALQVTLVAHGWPSWYAPSVVGLGDSTRFVSRDIERMLSDPLSERLYRPGRRHVLVRGRARGPLVGGCLAVLAALAGTRWQPTLRGAVLFLEEVGEAPYRIDRMLWQLRASGMLDGVKGLVVGQLTRCRPAPNRPSRSLRAILREHAEALGVPAMTGLVVGHGSKSRALPLGYTADLDAHRGAVSVRAPST
ncbi:MAG: LD-carboxypeptidase [Acidobacteriota bacterium]|nr:MAG: LD-carboxypeptidase [Acidobacteriota bacterium]